MRNKYVSRLYGAKIFDSSMRNKYVSRLSENLLQDDYDHCPLLLGLQDNKPGRPRFHFESFWTKLDGFQEAVASAWTSVPAGPCPFLTLNKKFKAITKDLQSWSDKAVGQVSFQLALAREILHQFEIAQDNRQLSPGEVWLKNNLKKRSLALASLKCTMARLGSKDQLAQRW